MSNHSFAVIDLETTGFANSDRIIEVGVVLTDAAGRIEKRWRTLVQPNRGFDNGFVHGITPSDLIDAPRFEDIAVRLADLLNGRIVVAHNASFEKRFLAAEFARVGLHLPADGGWLLDTMRSAKRILPGTSHKLAACLDAIGVENASAHTALADADATARLLAHLLPGMAVDLANYAPLHLDDADLAVVPSSTRPLLIRDDRLFADDDAAANGDETSAAGEASSVDDWMRRITGAAPGIGDGAADEYLALLADAMVDNRLDGDEVDQLLDAAHHLELSDDDVAELHELYVRQVSIEAWADGVVTAEERERLLAIADELAIGRARVSVWLAEPSGSPTIGSTPNESTGVGDGRDGLAEEFSGLVLRPGDRVTLTGAMAIPREEWARRAADAGLDVGGVCRRSRVLVAADVASMSGKAKRARELGVPVVGEREFAKMLAEMSAEMPAEMPAGTHDGEMTPSGPAAGFAAAVPEPVGPSGAEELDLGRIFPWLADVPETSTDAAGVVESWLAFRADVPLHAMSPVLEPASRPDGVDVSLKSTTMWFTRYPEPLSASVEDLRELRQVGRVKVRSFVYATVLQAIDDADARDAGDVDDADVLGDHDVDDDAASLPYGAFPGSADIYAETSDDAGATLAPEDIVAGWIALLGGWPSSSNAGAPGTPPALVVAAVDELPDPIERIFHCAIAEIDDAIGADDYRRPVILDGRVSGGKTLDELGRELGVTRERIRQLESMLFDDLRAAGTACALLHAAVAGRFGPCAPIEAVVDALPRLGDGPTRATTTLLELLPAIVVDGDSSWRVDDGWLVVGDVDDRIAEVVAAGADEYGILDQGRAASEIGITPEQLAARLAVISNVDIRDGVILTKIRSIPERAAAELVLAGEPLTTDRLMELIPDRSRRSIGNALSASELMRRCAVDTWALAEWGLEEWTSIVDFIKRRIAAAESGAVALERLIEEADGFGVKKGSVYAYTATPEFTVTDGMVRLTDNVDEIEIDAAPDVAKGLYLRDGAWSLLTTVTRDHLRGSGSGVPGGVIAVHGMRFGQSRELPSRLGPQRLSWMGNTTTTGTISRFMADLGCVEGDRVWLVFGDEFDVVPATPREEGLAGVAELLNATGLDDVCASSVDLDGVLAVVNEAMDLPADAARRKTVSRLRHRRDEELAELVRGL